MDNFLLTTAHRSALRHLTNEQKGILLDAIYAYAADGTVPTDKSAPQPVLVAFAFIREGIDSARQKYEARIEQNRINGRKGGRPRKNAAKTTSKTTKSATSRPRKTASKSKPAPQDSPAAEVKKNSSPLLSSPMTTVLPLPSKAIPESVKEHWNATVSTTPSCSLPPIKSLTPDRRQLILSRLADTGSDLPTLLQTIDLAARSAYINQGQPWATFDWVFSSKHFYKVLEGRYLTLKTQPTPSASSPAAPSMPPLPVQAPRTAAQLAHDLRLQQLSRQQRQNEAQRRSILSAIAAYNRNPRSVHAAVAIRAYNDGTTLRLGIAWTPGATNSSAPTAKEA